MSLVSSIIKETQELCRPLRQLKIYIILSFQLSKAIVPTRLALETVLILVIPRFLIKQCDFVVFLTLLTKRGVFSTV